MLAGSGKYISSTVKLLSVAIVISVFAGSTQAANVQFGAAMPQMTTIHKKVLSMREKRYEHIVRQETDFSCGAASLATILRYAYGLDVTEKDMLDGLFAVSNQELVREQGFSLLNIKHYVEQLGMRGRGYKMNAENLDKIQVPTIVLLDLKGYKHFVVLKRTVEDLVYIADPALGNKVLPKDEFVASWSGLVFAVIGKGYNRQSVLANPSAPLTARNLVNVFAPVSDAQLLEHGFTHAELF
ncbi:C39 family peptidase [Amphritea spongicola]|nr:C39 family peptidase [Aliamphritea spongicola]